MFEFGVGVGQISRKYGPHKSSQLGLELPSWLDMDYSHQFRYWQVYFKLSVAQSLHSSSRLIYMLAYLVLDAVARAAAVEVSMAHKKEFPLKSYKSCSELHSLSKCLAWVKKCHHVWLDQNFDPSLLTNKLWHVFMGMKQKG